MLLAFDWVPCFPGCLACVLGGWLVGLCVDVCVAASNQPTKQTRNQQTNSNIGLWGDWLIGLLVG